jgi:hypothetical protein
MSKNNYKEILFIFFLLAVIFVSGCEKSVQKGDGFLEGTISIGPLCPVETFPPDPACIPTVATFKAYQISVYSPDGKTKISQLNPSLDGSFSTELPTGNYLVALENSQSRIGGSNLPVEVSIASQDKTLLNIDIDTGIR